VSSRSIRLLIVIGALLLFVPFLGSVRLFDWDEINFAECAREMIVTGDYLHVHIDYQPFYEKPPVFIWLQVLSMKVFGINEFAARLPNAIIGVITLVLLFTFGERWFSRRTGLLWTALYAGSLLPHFYFRSGIIDPLFNLLIFLSVVGMMRRHPVSAGIFSGLAVLTKGPVGFGLVMLTTGISWFVLRKRMPLPWKNVMIATALTIAVTATWFGIDYLQNGPRFIMENLAYQVRLLTTGDAGHEQPFWYHPVVVLIGCYPASLLFFGALRRNHDETDEQNDTRIWMIVLMTVVLVVFSVVKTKIVHYSSMTYLPLTFLAALSVERWLSGRLRWRWWTSAGLVAVCLVLTTLGAAVPLAGLYVDTLMALPTFRDEYLRAAMQQPVPWQGYEPFVALLLPAGLILFFVWKRMYPLRALGALLSSVALFIFVFLPTVTPKVERYTQGAALDTYESLRGKDVYVKPLVMKSYAHLFYTDKPYALSAAAHGMEQDAWEPWLLDGDIDKPAYFVCKVNDAERWRSDPRLRIVKEWGGIVVFERIR